MGSFQVTVATAELMAAVQNIAGIAAENDDHPRTAIWPIGERPQDNTGRSNGWPASPAAWLADETNPILCVGES